MDTTARQPNWTKFLKLFGEQNNNRRTRLGVFEKAAGGATIDYWIEDELPLAGIDADARGKDFPTVEIMLGDAEESGSHHLTRVVGGARTMKIILSADGKTDGLEIEDAEGKTTILRFEN